MSYYNAREMVKDTQALCDEYGLVARTRKGKTIGFYEDVYAIDGTWDFDGFQANVQFQYVIEHGRWRCLAYLWDDDCWNGIKMPYQEYNTGERWHGYYEDLADCIENALEEIPVRAGAFYADADDYADEADDIDE